MEQIDSQTTSSNANLNILAQDLNPSHQNVQFFYASLRDTNGDKTPLIINVKHPLMPDWSIQTFNIHCPIVYLDLKKVNISEVQFYEDAIDLVFMESAADKASVLSSGFGSGEESNFMYMNPEDEGKPSLYLPILGGTFSGFECSSISSPSQDQKNMTSNEFGTRSLDLLQPTNIQMEKQSSNLMKISQARTSVDFEYIFPIEIKAFQSTICFLKARGSSIWSDILSFLRTMLDLNDNTTIFVYNTWQSNVYGQVSQVYDDNRTQVREIFHRVHGQQLTISISPISISNLPFTSLSTNDAISSKITKLSSPGVCGFLAPPNNCYMNSALQALTKTHLLKDFFLSKEYLYHINKTNIQSVRVVEGFAELVKQVWKGGYTHIDISTFKALAGQTFGNHFSSISQQDAGEIFRLLIDSLSEGLSQSTLALSTTTQSEVHNIFGGELRDEFECNSCGKKSYTTSPMTTINLPIPERPKSYDILVIFENNQRNPIHFELLVREYNLSELKNNISSQFNLSPSNLVITDSSGESIELDLNTNCQSLIAYNLESQANSNNVNYLQIEYSQIFDHLPTSNKKFTKTMLIPFAPNETTQDIIYNRAMQWILKYLSVDANELLLNAELYFPFSHESTNLPLLLDENGFPIQNTIETAFSLHGITRNGDRITLDYDNTPIPDLRYPTLTLRVSQTSKKLVNCSFEVDDLKPNLLEDTRINIEECLKLFQSSEKLPEYKCEVCKKSEATTQTRIWKSPQVLVLLLKRFSNENGKIEKKNDFIDFPFELNMKNFLPLTEKNLTEYELFSIINHYGSVNTGHYICFSKVGNQWIKFDDLNVTSVTTTDLRNEMEFAYMLLYSAKS